MCAFCVNSLHILFCDLTPYEHVYRLLTCTLAAGWVFCAATLTQYLSKQRAGFLPRNASLPQRCWGTDGRTDTRPILDAFHHGHGQRLTPSLSVSVWETGVRKMLWGQKFNTVSPLGGTVINTVCDRPTNRRNIHSFYLYQTTWVHRNIKKQQKINAQEHTQTHSQTLNKALSYDSI